MMNTRLQSGLRLRIPVFFPPTFESPLSCVGSLGYFTSGFLFFAMRFVYFIGICFVGPTFVFSAITKLVLVNTGTGADLFDLKNASVIDVSTTGKDLSVRAETDDLFLRFDLDDGVSVRVESVAPFMLAGKSTTTGKLYRSHRLSQHGDHRLIVTPQSDGSLPIQRILGVQEIDSYTVEFKVVDGLNSPVFEDEDQPADNVPAFSDVSETPYSSAGTVSYHHGVISVGFSGPVASETATTDPTPYRRGSPFADYRLDLLLFFDDAIDDNVTIPCYYAGAGTIAANTHATSGSVWLCHWRPNETKSKVTYRAQFSQGTNVILPESIGEPAGFMDGATGTLLTPEDELINSIFLDVWGDETLRHANGSVFEVFGLASPNLLESAYFDGLNETDAFTFDDHLADFTGSFPTWAKGKGASIVGALEYLKRIGINAIAVRPADGLVSAFAEGQEEADLFLDTSRLAQWYTLLNTASRLGMVICFELRSLSSAEINSLFVREMVARFGHLPILWHTADKGTIKILRQVDPYQHPIVSKRMFAQASSYVQILSQPRPAGLFWKAATDNFRLVDWSSISGTRNWIRPLFPFLNLFS